METAAVEALVVSIRSTHEDAVSDVGEGVSAVELIGCSLQPGLRYKDDISGPEKDVF